MRPTNKGRSTTKQKSHWTSQPQKKNQVKLGRGYRKTFNVVCGGPVIILFYFIMENLRQKKGKGMLVMLIQDSATKS